MGRREALSNSCTFLLLLCMTFLEVAARKTSQTATFGIRNKWPLCDNMHSLLPSKIKYSRLL